MKNLMNVIEWTVYSIIVFIVGDFFYTNPTFNVEYVVKLLVAAIVYIIFWTIYFKFHGE